MTRPNRVPPKLRDRKDVLDEILAERRRQVEVEGWDAAHDDRHAPGELYAAGLAYFRHATGCCVYRMDGTPEDWPWFADWWKPKDRRRDLVRAAALIVAERDRKERMGVEVYLAPTDDEVAVSLEQVIAALQRLDVPAGR